MNVNSNKTYKVLARKYRPRTFEDMIGQEAMVTTLRNAFEVSRVAHAFMLTGVRGIGKTTTARLLARALNYESDSIEGPSVNLMVPGKHCDLIMSSSHMDVLEIDAASRTGVENMRELLDGVRYAPASARYKVYIIDEVHMLSTGAFNALLKTLEEPPDHAKFIFATTEIRKVPITVLSRCQRFDLRRVASEEIKTHLSGICKKEKANIADEGLSLISRAAEGSVRDSLSLLDQAIVQADMEGSMVSAENIRVMLGLANKARTIELFELAALGSIKAALILIRELYDGGADAIIMMKDLLDVCHEVSRAKVLGSEALSDMTTDQANLLQEISKKLTVGQLTRIWQILIKSYDEVRVAPLPIAAAEMVLLKLSTAGLLPPPELATKMIKEMSTQSAAKGKTDQLSVSGNSVNAGHPNHYSAAERVLNTEAIKEISTLKNTMLVLNTLEEIVEALPDSDIILKSNIKRYVKPIKVKQGMIVYQPSEGAPKDLSGSIVTALKNLTGDLWAVSPEIDGGGSTLKELEKLSQIAQDEKDKSHPIFMHSLISKAELIKIYNLEDEPGRNNVIKGNFGEQE